MTRDREGETTPADEAPPQEPISQGILLEGKYRLHEQIGRGGMGTVFRAMDELLDREVAVKFLNPQFQTDPSFSERFTQEARALASVRHANVLEIFSFGTYGRTPFFVMEYVHGVTMAEVIKAGAQKGRKILAQEAIRVIAQACAGLAAVHRADVVHRDIKPANLMVQATTRQIVLMDFGLGQRWKPTRPKVETWIPGGTPAYMAPEMFFERRLDIWEARLADIYSLGATAYELLTGNPPFVGESWPKLVGVIVREEPPWPSTVRPDLPASLDPVIMRCLAKNPSMRYQHCEELQQALLPFVRDAGREPVPDSVFPLPPTEPPPPPPPPPRPEPDAAEKPDRESVRNLLNLRSHPRFLSIKRAGVLVADPDPGFRTRVLQFAEEAIPGCTFHAARTNLSALELARKSPPAILLANLNDPKLNGLELIATIRGDERLRNIQVILTVERVTSQDKVLLARMGVIRTVLKTIDSTELGPAISEAASAALVHGAGGSER